MENSVLTYYIHVSLSLVGFILLMIGASFELRNTCDNVTPFNLTMDYYLKGLYAFYSFMVFVSVIGIFLLVSIRRHFWIIYGPIGIEVLFLMVWTVLGGITIYGYNVECLLDRTQFIRFVEANFYLGLISSTQIIGNGISRLITSQCHHTDEYQIMY